MSIMDIAASLMGSNPSAKMLGQVSEMITQGGGLNGLISKFQNAGLESHVNSWVGNGENLPVSAEQIKNVVGAEGIQKLVSSLGGTSEGIAGQLSSMLPMLINQLTPNGAFPAEGISKDFILNAGMELIKHKLFS